MKTLKAAKPKGRYKSTEQWIDAVYRNNKSTIDIAFADFRKPKKTFKSLVRELIEEGFTPTKAMSTVAKSTHFTTEKERLQTNMWSGLKADKDAYRTFRELTKEKGKYSKFDVTKLQWNKEEQVYVYGSVLISFQNSPYGVIVRKI